MATIQRSALLYWRREGALPGALSSYLMLGWLDSNQRMADSKPAALPLGDTPMSTGGCYGIGVALPVTRATHGITKNSPRAALRLYRRASTIHATKSVQSIR